MIQESADPKDDQDNIGYENTETRNDQDDRENNRTQTTDTGHGEGPKENEADTGGLRSESGKKSLGKESGNKEPG
jgi:hypothetical protein